MMRMLLLVLSFALPGLVSGAGEQARMMVHLLDYIAVDYAVAVDNNQVANQAEYAEMQEFSAALMRMGSEASPSIINDLKLLQKLIEQKSSIEKVNSVATSAKQQIINFYSLEVAPKRWPSLVHGEELYQLHCQGCHGKEGYGDGPLAPGLEPRPSSFQDPLKANQLSPFQAYNTIRLGVEGTGMRAFDELNDDEAWDLAFYLLSFPHQHIEDRDELVAEYDHLSTNLQQLASKNNEELQMELGLQMPQTISALRLFPREIAQRSQGDYLEQARSLTNKALSAYQDNNYDVARGLILSAYLEGVEPVEAQLRARDAGFVSSLETQMAQVRSAIEREKPFVEVQAVASESLAMLAEAEDLLAEDNFSGWLAFLMSSSIILREGLEAFLVIITILGIVRSLKLPRAARWIHAGWIAAVGLGFILWLAAGRLFSFSGAQRELMEGIVALFAVGVLLYVGFWMHSKSEAGKWQAYIKDKIQGLARTENMIGLAFLSFLVVFREAFESVLFLSALSLEVGPGQQVAFGSGVFVAFLLLFVIAIALLKYSKRIPITKLFRYSAMVISFLAVVLVGKGIHAIQEAGALSMSIMPTGFKFEWLGFYPSWEGLIAQLLIVGLIVLLWNFNNRSSSPSAAPAKSTAG